MAAPNDDFGYANLYSNISMFPELGRFRRFRGEWAKLLHDDTKEVRYWQGKIREELKIAGVPPSGADVWKISRAAVRKHHREIYEDSWLSYENALRQYGSDFCISQQMVTHPDQPSYATKFLSRFKEPIFQNGKFSLTGEDECFYKGPSETHDSLSWRMTTSMDFLAEWIYAMIDRIDRIDNVLFRYIRRLFGSSKARDDPPYIRYHRLVETMDVITCILISLILTSAIFALKSIQSWNSRGGVIGAMGVVFSLAVKFLAGGPSRRIEVYAATAAFFAVASVFVSSSGN